MSIYVVLVGIGMNTQNIFGDVCPTKDQMSRHVGLCLTIAKWLGILTKFLYLHTVTHGLNYLSSHLTLYPLY